MRAEGITQKKYWRIRFNVGKLQHHSLKNNGRPLKRCNDLFNEPPQKRSKSAGKQRMMEERQ
jgi:hypothetical protein